MNRYSNQAGRRQHAEQHARTQESARRAAMRPRAQGENVSCASIMVAWVATFERPYPNDLAFATAGADLAAHRPADWRELFAAADAARAELDAAGTKDYSRELAGAIVRERFYGIPAPVAAAA